MDLKSLSYTSLARLDIDAADLETIHRTARDLNALDGITGLLVFNGTHFLQIIEGGAEAVDDLVERLRRDPRHGGFEIRDERRVDRRSFPEWSMALFRISGSYLEARESISGRLPDGIAPEVRQRLLTMTQTISGRG